MEIWIDAQLSPALALWINQTFPGVHARSVRSLGLRDADDETIFKQAKQQAVIIMSKDVDFVTLLQRHGAPPQVVWVAVGNTSNANMRLLLQRHFVTIQEMIRGGEPLIELRGSDI